MRLVIRRIPGYFWVQFAITRPQGKWFLWDEPLYRGIVRAYRVGPFWMATLPKSDAKHEVRA